MHVEGAPRAADARASARAPRRAVAGRPRTGLTAPSACPGRFLTDGRPRTPPPRPRQEGDRFWRMAECYVRGNTIKYLRVADEVLQKVEEESARRQGASPRARARPGSRLVAAGKASPIARARASQSKSASTGAGTGRAGAAAAGTTTAAAAAAAAAAAEAAGGDGGARARSGGLPVFFFPRDLQGRQPPVAARVTKLRKRVHGPRAPRTRPRR